MYMIYDIWHMLFTGSESSSFIHLTYVFGLCYVMLCDLIHVVFLDRMCCDTNDMKWRVVTCINMSSSLDEDIKETKKEIAELKAKITESEKDPTLAHDIQKKKDLNQLQEDRRRKEDIYIRLLGLLEQQQGGQITITSYIDPYVMLGMVHIISMDVISSRLISLSSCLSVYLAIILIIFVVLSGWYIYTISIYLYLGISIVQHNKQVGCTYTIISYIYHNYVMMFMIAYRSSSIVLSVWYHDHPIAWSSRYVYLCISGQYNMLWLYITIDTYINISNI